MNTQTPSPNKPMFTGLHPEFSGLRRMWGRMHGRQPLVHLGRFVQLTAWIALPGFLGLAVSLWIDAQWPNVFHWRLGLLLLGIALGCLNAWYWSQPTGDDSKNSH